MVLPMMQELAQPALSGTQTPRLDNVRLELAGARPGPFLLGYGSHGAELVSLASPGRDYFTHAVYSAAWMVDAFIDLKQQNLNWEKHELYLHFTGEVFVPITRPVAVRLIEQLRTTLQAATAEE